MSTLKPGDQLRKIAEELREEAKKLNKKKVTKCAQILTAAQGLQELERTIYGEQ